MKEQIILDLYKEQTTHARHTETQRLEVTKFILAAVAALLSVTGALKFSIHCIPLGIAIIYLGYLQLRITRTYVERFDRHMDRARALRRAVDTLATGGGVQAIFDDNPVLKVLENPRFLEQDWDRYNYARDALHVVELRCYRRTHDQTVRQTDGEADRTIRRRGTDDLQSQSMRVPS